MRKLSLTKSKLSFLLNQLFGNLEHHSNGAIRTIVTQQRSQASKLDGNLAFG